MTYADKSFETTGYDPLGRVISRTDAKGLTTQYGYDALGRLTSVTDALKQVTQYGYDEVGNRITQTDANSHTTSYAYDQRGRRLSRTLPVGQTESYTYNAAGNMLTKTDFNGKTTTYAYDVMNHMLSKTPDPSFNAAPVTCTYDNAGRRSSMTDLTGWHYYYYDPLWGLSGIHRLSGDDINYTFDKAGNLTQMQSSVTVYYGYDALNRLSTVWESNSGTAKYAYDNVGNLASVAYANGVAHNYTYDVRNRLTNLSVSGTVAGAGGPIASYGYTLDASGHRTSVAELSGRTVNYGYDNLYRLTSETIASDPHNVNGAVSYIYDPVGNRTQKTSTLPGYPGGLSNYNANDELTTDTYDANGNTTASIGKGYVYDFENHLIQAGGISYVYDGDGNRVGKNVAGAWTTYSIDPRSLTGYPEVIHEQAPVIGATYYVYGLELLDLWRYGYYGPTATWYMHDGHGSVRALTDSTGAVTDTYDYDAFGNLLHQTGTTPNNYLFAGEQFDPDLGLYYNRARYLNVSTGRFWTMDIYEGIPNDPTSLHKYLYASADPVGRVDPSGNDSVSEMTIALAVSTVLLTMSGCAAKPQIITVGVDFQNVWDLGPDPEDLLTGPEQDLLKQTALQTMRDAYRGYAVLFNEGPSGMRNIHVTNTLGPGAGQTIYPSLASNVYFWNLWLTLQDLLGCYHLGVCVRHGYDRTTLAMALGRGIGATGAHELGHQGGLNFVVETKGCDNCYDSESAASLAHFFEQLHWSDGAKARMRAVLPRGPDSPQ